VLFFASRRIVRVKRLLMVWVEMSLINWVLIWIMFGGFKLVVLVNEVGWGGFYVNMDWSSLEWA